MPKIDLINGDKEISLYKVEEMSEVRIFNQDCEWLK
jgi:hypothetical protein